MYLDLLATDLLFIAIIKEKPSTMRRFSDMADNPNMLCDKCHHEFFANELTVDTDVECPKCAAKIDIIKARDEFDKQHGFGKYAPKPRIVENGKWRPPSEMSYPACIHHKEIDEIEYPDQWVGWINGFPFTANLSFKKKKEDSEEDNERVPQYDLTPITLSNFNEIKGPLFTRIKKFEDEGKICITYDENTYEKEKFIRKMTRGQHNQDLLTHAIESIPPIPPSESVATKPVFKIKEDHFIFPQRVYPTEAEGYITKLVRELNIGPMGQGMYNEALELLQKHPKQLTLFYAIIGAHITNLLAIENFPLRISALGKSRSGKTFTIKLVLKLVYGIGEAYLQDDALDSTFRFQAIASATNLPIYIDEAKITDKKKLKSLYSNVRGRPDQSSKIYEPIATIVLSANSDDFLDPNVDEQQAVDRRILKYYFGEEDIISHEEEVLGKHLENTLKTSPGGIIYKILEGKSVKDLKKKYSELDSESESMREKIAVFGAWLMGDENFKPIVENIPEPDIADEFFTAIVSIGIGLKFRSLDMGFEEKKYRGHLNVNPIEGTMKIDTEGVNNFLKSRSMRESLRNLSARSFIKNYLEPKGFVYESNYIDNYKEGNKMVARGPIPEKYRTNMIPPPTLGNARIPTFDINDEKSL